jgi:hypothetical protein
MNFLENNFKYMKKVLEKLKEARNIIKSSDLKKDGRNEYSKFDYYTPEQVEALVDKACKETNTIVLCNLKADEFGLYQTLEFIDLESEEKLSFEMRTKHGSITATNETQQMGGTDTYSERYIKMKVFQIKDNNLDIDSQDNRKQTVKNTINTSPQATQAPYNDLKVKDDKTSIKKEIIRLCDNLDTTLQENKKYKEFVRDTCGVELEEKNFDFVIKTLKELNN